MTMMYMYSGLPLYPYLIPSGFVPSLSQWPGQASHLHPTTTGHQDLLASAAAYKSPSGPVGVLTDPPPLLGLLPPIPPGGDYKPAPGTDCGDEHAEEPLAVAGSSPLAGGDVRAAKGARPLTLARKDNSQLKFGIDRILGTRSSSERARKEKNSFGEIWEQDRSGTRTDLSGAAPAAYDTGVTGLVQVTCNGWQSDRSLDQSPGYTTRTADGSSGNQAGIQVQLPHKLGRVKDFCQGCYQDTSTLLHHSCNLWPFSQYQYQYRHHDPSQCPTAEPQPPVAHHVTLPLSTRKPHTTPNHSHHHHHHPRLAGGTGRRKRSWSRAVFTNLQRKGLEKRFEIQKYVNKPDRRQLAAALGLTDAQVKVWFQNRRMKWRHLQRMQKQQGQAADTPPAVAGGATQRLADECSGGDE